MSPIFELPEKFGKFLFYIILDIIGSVLVGIGLTAFFGDVHLIPVSWRFENYPIFLIIVGIFLIVPFIVFMVKTILARMDI